VEVYDPPANTWSTATSMPTARDFLAAAAVNGKIYAIGGMTSNFVSGVVSTVEVYDPATYTWITAAPTLSTDLTVAGAVNGKIYAISLGEVYDPATNTWSTAAPMPTATGSALGVADVNGLIYAIKETTGVEQFSPPATIFTFIKN